MFHTMNSTIAEIKLKNLIYNFNSIRRKTKTKVMAVVKADAYGHGMLKCVEALSRLKNKPEYYGVALLEEALELRNSKLVAEPILCFAPLQIDLISQYSKKQIIPTISTAKHIEQLSKIKKQKPIKVHLNINTGMNRLGISHEIAFEQISKLKMNTNIIIDGIYTHFATSDEKDKSFANLQLERFTTLVNLLKTNKINYGLAHTANSGAILDMSESFFDMVRPGISLYGYYPSLETSESLKFKPVMSLISRLSTTSLISKGESVGYGRLFTAHEKTKIGTIPIGYADGLLRGLSNKIKIIIGDDIFDQIGRVSMDRIIINLGNKNIREGSKVILIGKSKKYNINAWDWSKILDTIPYEVTCGISKRVPRKYV